MPTRRTGVLYPQSGDIVVLTVEEPEGWSGAVRDAVNHIGISSGVTIVLLSPGETVQDLNKSGLAELADEIDRRLKQQPFWKRWFA